MAEIPGPKPWGRTPGGRTPWGRYPGAETRGNQGLLGSPGLTWLARRSRSGEWQAGSRPVVQPAQGNEKKYGCIPSEPAPESRMRFGKVVTRLDIYIFRQV